MVTKKKETTKAKAGNERAKKGEENIWTGNFYGVVGFICGVVGLIIYPIFFGVMAVGFGFMNMKREEKNLWKLAIPLGVIDLLFVVVLIVYYSL